ncbi:MAG: hypothetical protein ACREPY_12930 [Rhodanobacteraceae bacterium]
MAKASKAGQQPRKSASNKGNGLPASRATRQAGANLGFEAKLWQAADKLRNNYGRG